MLYQVDPKYYYRLHHPRPRFKRQVEDVINYMAQEIVRIGKDDEESFATKLNAAIWRFPGNINLEKKTVDNWRTEIDALFGLVKFADSDLAPSKLAQKLAETSDLVSFFRTFLCRFQYPGGHQKPHVVADAIQHGVKFKPADFLIRTMLAFQALGLNAGPWITKSEATALIWNDLRVTTGLTTPEDIARSLVSHRKNKTEFDNSGDVVRYAGDILDYLVLANIFDLHPSGRYVFIPGARDAIDLVLSNNQTFCGYESLYNASDLPAEVCHKLEPAWKSWVGDEIDQLVSNTDPIEVLQAMVGRIEAPAEAEAVKNLIQFLRDKIATGDKIGTKETGDAGEGLILKHEYNRLSKLGLENLAKKVQKLPDHFGVGYDIKSFLDAEETSKLIEVKSSISHGMLKVRQFHLTKNEWKTAEITGENYFIYRVLISNTSIRCFVIQNPVGAYKQDKITMTIGDGADVSYEETSGYWEELLLS